MSDYLTRLIERSVGLPPQIEPLIAPIHAQSGQTLSEAVETYAAFESGPGTAVNAGAVQPTFSEMGGRPPRPSSPLPGSPAEFPNEKKDDRAQPTESQTKVRSRQTSSASLPRAAPIVSQGTTQIVDQPEMISHLKPATSPPVPALESSPKKPPLSPRTITTGLKRTTQIVVQPKLISHLKPAATPAVSLLQPCPKEPPAIHVTIGRVEVRVVTPPVAALKSAPPSAPKFSLEDYLKRRNGERS